MKRKEEQGKQRNGNTSGRTQLGIASPCLGSFLSQAAADRELRQKTEGQQQETIFDGIRLAVLAAKLAFSPHV